LKTTKKLTITLALALMLCPPTLFANTAFNVNALEAAGVSHTEIQRRFEQEVIRLVNVIRRDHGLPPLVYHSGLGRVARTRTDVMIAHNSSGTHRCPVTGLEHTAYARHLGLNVSFAGENAAWGSWTLDFTPLGAHS